MHCLHFELAKDNAMFLYCYWLSHRRVTSFRCAYLKYLSFPAMVYFDNRVCSPLLSKPVDKNSITLNGEKGHVKPLLVLSGNLPKVKTSLLQKQEKLRALCICFQHHRCYCSQSSTWKEWSAPETLIFITCLQQRNQLIIVFLKYYYIKA